jgi:hypothetical protein
MSISAAGLRQPEGIPPSLMARRSSLADDPADFLPHQPFKQTGARQ